jgi:hypothetical protein
MPPHRATHATSSANLSPNKSGVSFEYNNVASCDL